MRREEALTVAKVQDEIVAEERRAADQSQKEWERAQSTINSAFTSQIGGLMHGTESWSTAMKNTLATLTEDMLKFFVEWGLKAVENAALQAAAQNQATAGIVAALGLQGAAQAAASKASALATVQADLGQAYAGFAAWFAPILGPGALGAAAGLASGVEGTALGIAAFDIGAWNVPADQIALIHRNELVMPAAEAGALRSMLSSASSGGPGGSNVAINPTVNIHTSFVDAAGADQFWRNDQRGLMRAVDEAVWHGAHLGLRRINL